MSLRVARQAMPAICHYVAPASYSVHSPKYTNNRSREGPWQSGRICGFADFFDQSLKSQENAVFYGFFYAFIPRRSKPKKRDYACLSCYWLWRHNRVLDNRSGLVAAGWPAKLLFLLSARAAEVSGYAERRFRCIITLQHDCVAREE